MAVVSSSHARSVWVSILAALFGGIAVGAVAKFADESRIPGVGMIGTHFGVWLVLVVVVAAWSDTWQRAILHALIFLLAMLAAYYVASLLLFGFFLTPLLLAWAAVALVLTPPFAALVWRARRAGWLAALGAALPVGLLLWEAYSLRLRLDHEDYKIVFMFDIVAAVTLLLILPRNRVAWLRAFASTPIIVLSVQIVNEYVLPVVVGFRL